MLTIFTCPKPFTDPHIRMIQRNAIQSWMQLEPRPEILLMGDDEGVRETAEEFGLRYIPDIRKNEYGTPLVSSIWSEAEKAVSSRMLCYINADIILMPLFMSMAELCEPLERFMIGGLRWNLDVLKSIDYSNSQWHANLLAEVEARGVQFDIRGIDYFLFSRGLWPSMPAFALGRLAWDNWLLYGAIANGGKLIDGSRKIKAIHQNHGYSHSFGKDLASICDGSEARRNYALADAQMFDLLDCRYGIVNGKVKIFRDYEHVYRRVERLSILHPRLFKMMLSWKLRYVFCWLFPKL